MLLTKGGWGGVPQELLLPGPLAISIYIHTNHCVDQEYEQFTHNLPNFEGHQCVFMYTFQLRHTKESLHMYLFNSQVVTLSTSNEYVRMMEL